MFKGTDTLPAGAIDYLFRQGDADNNAETGTDFTQYFELVPSTRLEPMLRLEADRMEHSAFRPEDLAHEMVVVRSELEGDVNDPGYELYNYGLLPAAFVANPYHWPAIGFTADVEAVQHNRTVIYTYYKQHYMPNNAVVVIVGDFATSQAVALCQKYFGVYAAGVVPEHHITPEPRQSGPKMVTLQRPGTTGELLVGFHDPGLGTPDHYTMDVISQILSGGESARMYQDFVEPGLAQSAVMFDPDQKDPYLDIFDITPQSGVSLDKLQDTLFAEIARLQNEDISQAELQQAVSQIDAQYVYGKDSISDQADIITEYAAIGFQNYQDTYLAHIHKVTPAMIRAVAAKYFTSDNRTEARFDPTTLAPGQTLPPPPSGEHFGSRQSAAQQEAQFAPLAKSYGLDKFTPSKVTSHPTRVVLPNGLTIIVQENHSNPDIAIDGYVKAGSFFGGDNRVVSSTTAEMLDRGTITKSHLQLAQELDSVGATLRFEPGSEEVNIAGQCLTKDFGLTIGTLADELMNPSFPDDELQKVIADDYSGLEQARQDTGGTSGAGTLAQIAFDRALFPAGHPYWSPTLDDLESQTKAITRADISDFYGKYYRPDSTVLVIVGDVDTKKAIQTLTDAFGGWAKPSTPTPVVTIPDVPVPSAAPAPITLALPGTSQTSILFGFPGELKRTDKDYYASFVANYILGGDVFGSRLGHQIRDVEGLTYTVYSHFSATLGAGSWSVFAGSNPANAPQTLSEIKRISADYVAHGATQEELTQTKRVIMGEFPARLTTNAGVAVLLSAAELYGLGLDYPNRYIGIIGSLTLAQVDAAAKAHLHPGNAVAVEAGAVGQ
jgi:zinc protease